MRGEGRGRREGWEGERREGERGGEGGGEGRIGMGRDERKEGERGGREGER